MKNTNSSFAGFIEGYRAGNINNFSPDIARDRDILLDSLIKLESALGDEKDLNCDMSASEVGSIRKILTNEALEVVIRARQVGKSLQDFLMLEKKNILDKEYIRKHVSNVILAFLNFAKTLKDGEVIKYALSVGNRLEEINQI